VISLGLFGVLDRSASCWSAFGGLFPRPMVPPDVKRGWSPGSLQGPGCYCASCCEPCSWRLDRVIAAASACFREPNHGSERFGTALANSLRPHPSAPGRAQLLPFLDILVLIALVLLLAKGLGWCISVLRHPVCGTPNRQRLPEAIPSIVQSRCCSWAPGAAQLWGL